MIPCLGGFPKDFLNHYFSDKFALDFLSTIPKNNIFVYEACYSKIKSSNNFIKSFYDKPSLYFRKQVKAIYEQI